MDRQQILLAKTLEAAGIPLKVDTFDQRLILQKAVYLLQAAALHLGYRYRWYLRGPYCTEVAGDAFGIIREGRAAKDELATWGFDNVSAEKARKLKSLLDRDGESEVDKARRLELLASVLFLVKTRQTSPDDINQTNKILNANDKHYSDEEVQAAFEELRDNGLLN